MDSCVVNKLLAKSVPFFDRFSIGVSFLCMLHCLVTPLLIVAIPTLGATFFAGETLHFCLIFVVVPCSIFALWVGCRQHKHVLSGLLGVFGLCCLVFALNLESLSIDHVWETPLTVLGSLLLSLAHIRNFQLCRRLTQCDCHQKLSVTP